MDTSSLESFLRSSKSHVQIAVGDTLGDSHVILGNEAADLDSVVSALITGYFVALSVTKEKENKAEDQRSYVFPVVNCLREDLPLRTEVTYFLNANGIPVECLICRDEIDLNSLQAGGKLKLTLVDHNVLGEKDLSLGGSVVKVIDHHKRERPLDPRDVIEPVGSCATLVGEMALGVFDTDLVVCNLLYGTILLDTVNLSPTAMKATTKDFKVVGELEEILEKGGKSGRSCRDELFKGIETAKRDVSKFSADQLLKKDAKVLRTPEISVDVPSVPLLSQKFLELEGATEALRNCLRMNRVSVVVVMGSEVGDGGANMRRDLTVFSDTIHKAKTVVTPLENCEDLQLQLIKQCTDSQSSVWVYNQGNVGLSRKFILPFLASHFETKAQNQLDVVDALGGVEIFPGGDLSPNKLGTGGMILPSISVGNLGVGDPISHGGSNQSSAYNSCPYTPQNSCAEPSDEDIYSGETYFLPSFNSREMIEKIEMKRGKLRGYDKTEDQLNPGASSYPFTPKNSYVDSSMDTYFSTEARQSNHQMGGSGGGILHAIDSEILLRKLLEKRRGDGGSSCGNSNGSSKSQSLTKLNVEGGGGEGGDASGSTGSGQQQVTFGMRCEIPPNELDEQK